MGIATGLGSPIALVAPILLGTSLMLSASAPPAGQGASSWCLPDGTAATSSNSAPAARALERGAESREPDIVQEHIDLPDDAKGKADRSLHVDVPVFFHVITDGPIGAVTDEHVADQLRVLNLTFGGVEGGDRTQFRFRLRGLTRTDNAQWFYASFNGGAEDSMKRSLRRGGDDTLNIYSTTAGPYLGWAYLPEIVTKPGRAHLDGVVIDWESMPGTSTRYAGRYDEGKTATHEVGHWLNLEHTFYGGCNAHGDFVADTPAQRVPSAGCPEGQDSCRQPGLDPIHNYMDYSDDPCYTQFTPGQTQRMKDAWLFFRSN